MDTHVPGDRRLRARWRALAASLILAASASAQTPDLSALIDPADLPEDLCSPQWEALFGAEPGVGMGNGSTGGTGRVNDAIVFDDGLGGGPALYVGGAFLTAGGKAASNLARWDGSTWSDVGGGVDGPVHTLEVANFSGLDELYIGGDFSAGGGGAAVSNLARWNGIGFSAVDGGTDGPVYSLLKYPAPADLMLVGGDFSTAGGEVAPCVALFNPTLGFSSVGAGFNGPVRALALHQGATFAGGSFSASGATPLNNLALLSAGNWGDLGGGVTGPVYALESFDDGGGPALMVGGSFGSVGSPAQVAGSVVAWRGGSWELLGGGVFGTVWDLQVWNDGGGDDLYLAGAFTTVGFVTGIEWVARWNGTAFTGLGADLEAGFALSLGVYDDGNGESLWLGGHYHAVGGRGADGLARWSGSSWHTTNEGLNYDVEVLCSTSFEDSPALYVGGNDWLHAPGTVDQRALARWKDGAWSGIGDANLSVRAMAEFDDGGGPALYVGGYFTQIDGLPRDHIARWDGSAWSSVGGGIDGAVTALEVWDDGSGPALYAGGSFALAGGVLAEGMARWDGSSWSALAGGLHDDGGSQTFVRDMLAFDDGSGDALYVTGQFWTVNGAPGNSIARWDGSAWSALGSGLLLSGGGPGQGWALAAYDGGSGERLFVGGRFNTAGGSPGSANFAAWTGSAWTGVSGTVNDTVYSLAVWDHGDGPLLHLGGAFTQIDLFPLKRLARWNGSTWSGMGSGISVSPGAVKALVVHDDCTSVGPRLIVGGGFTAVPNIDPDLDPGGGSYLAAWRGCWDDPNAWTDLGFALAGTFGDPLLVGTGTLALDSVNTLNLSNAAPTATAGLFLSFSSTPTPFAGGILVPVPPLDPIIVTTSSLGTIPLTSVIASCLPPGITLYAQWGIADAAAVAGIALSNAVVGETP